MSSTHDRILKFCRKVGQGYVMRQLSGDDAGKVAVLDLNRTEPKPGGYEWERREVCVAVGDNWEAVATALDTAALSPFARATWAQIRAESSSADE